MPHSLTCDEHAIGLPLGSAPRSESLLGSPLVERVGSGLGRLDPSRVFTVWNAFCILPEVDGHPMDAEEPAD